MSERLYDVIRADPIGCFPGVYELPGTIEGTRVVAMEALHAGELGVLDRLELHAVRLLKIEPQDGKYEGSEPIALFHTERGIVIRWRVYSEGECPACSGSGELVAFGNDGMDYEVTCPRCHGTRIAEDRDEEEVETDIDGMALAA